VTDDDPLAISALQHWAYCPRQCGLIHLEQAFDAGRFKARLEGAVTGNVLLRQAQHRAPENEGFTFTLARNIVAGKLKISAKSCCAVPEKPNKPGTKPG